jgi:uroporphyrinogen-III synthase
MKQVLSGKKLSEETIAFAHSLNLDIQCMNFIEVKPEPFDFGKIKNSDFDAVAFTSLNGVKFFLSIPGCKELAGSKKIFSLSGATAGILLKYGIQPAIIADDAESLADKIIKNQLAKSVLHPSGSLKLDILEQKLASANIRYNPLLVYKTELNKDIKTDKSFDAILFFSPSGVESFLNVNNWDTKTIACCIGKTTAESFRKEQPDAIIITPFLPAPESMIKAISNHFQKDKAEA